MRAHWPLQSGYAFTVAAGSVVQAAHAAEPSMIESHTRAPMACDWDGRAIGLVVRAAGLRFDRFAVRPARVAVVAAGAAAAQRAHGELYSVAGLQRLGRPAAAKQTCRVAALEAPVFGAARVVGYLEDDEAVRIHELPLDDRARELDRMVGVVDGRRMMRCRRDCGARECGARECGSRTARQRRSRAHGSCLTSGRATTRR